MERIWVHGGVSGRPKEMPDLTACARRGVDAPSALEAVERAVIALEDHPALNAGFGATLNRNGELELDAALADGTTGRHGGVAAVRVKNPITLARLVLTDTPHVLMVGEGAMALGPELELLEATTPEQRERYDNALRDGTLEGGSYAAPEHVDTVGAVALGPNGDLAAGSSTGGVFGKLPGRVGDSAIPGAGTYASPKAAVVGTGVGEAFLETLACFRVARLIEEGTSAQEACERIVALVARERGVSAGLLALSDGGDLGAAFHGGSWAVAGPDGPIEAEKID